MSSWSTPKEDWAAPDGVAYSDMNRIEANTNYLKESVAWTKLGTGTFTDNDTSQDFTDAFCTVDSDVTVRVTSGTPAGDWTVTANAGSFNITSSQAESADISFNYTILKAGA